eukprot:718252-Rhodomonas_salina.1
MRGTRPEQRRAEGDERGAAPPPPPHLRSQRLRRSPGTAPTRSLLFAPERRGCCLASAAPVGF